MSEEFTHQLLRAVVGRVCQPLGVHGMQQSVCDSMADLLKHYIMTLGKTAASYTAHANRTEANVSDVFQAFRDLGVNISELEEFKREVESVPPPQPVPRYPIPRSSTHVYHAPSSGGKPGVTRRSRTGSLSSEDESDRDHIPPYLPPLPLEEEEEKEVGEEMEVADQSDLAEVVTSDTRLPPDPTKGLPQLFRSRRLSSDFSEEGDNAGSRRNSVSNGAFARTPGVPTNENAATEITNNRGTIAMGKEERGGDTEVPMETEAPSLAAVKKVNVFDVAFSQKLSESRERQKPVQPAEQAPPGQEASGAIEAPPTLTAKPIKQELQTSQPAQPVIFQKPHERVLPPPLKLMSPTSEHPNQTLPTQQPSLSPLTTRSPVQVMGMPRMPVLSPLRTPTSANRHPMRAPGNLIGPSSGSSLISPPSLRSPVEPLPPPIEAHPHGTVPSTAHTLHRVHGTVPPQQLATSQIPFSAHPPSKPFSAQPLQVQATPSSTSVSQSSALPTSEVSFEEAKSGAAERKETIKNEKENLTTSPQELSPVLSEKDEKEQPISDVNLRGRDTHMASEDVLRSSKELSPGLSASSSSSGSPSPIDKRSEFKLTTPERETEDEATIDKSSSSPQPTVKTAESDTLEVSRVDRLSLSPASMKESVASRESTPGDVSAVGETSLQDLEISDDEGLSDDEEEEGEGGGGESEDGALAKQPLPPPLIVVKEEEDEQKETYHEGEISAPVGGKKLMKKELSLSPVSSAVSAELELDADASLGEGVDDVDFSTQDALSLVHLTKEEEGDFDEEYDKEPIASSAEQLENVSSDEDVADTAVEREVPSPDQRSEFTGGREEVEQAADTKVKVLESASVQFDDDGVQDMGTVEEVLEVLEQKFSSDEDSEDSDEDKGGGVVVKEEIDGEGGVVSEVGVVSGEGLIVEEDDMVETLSAMVHTPQATVTTESVPNSSKLVSLDELLGKKKPAPPPTPPRPKSLKVSFKRHLVPSLRPEPKSKPRAPSPAPQPQTTSLKRHHVATLRPEAKSKARAPSPTPPPPTVSRFLTKAEKKADVVSHHLHHLHGSGAIGHGGGLIVTQGETKSLPLPPSAPHTPSASPTPSPEDELDQPLVITINRRLLRHPQFGLPTPVEERPRVPSANAIKMKFARFGAPFAPTTGGVVSGHVTTTPSVNPRKRDRDSDSGPSLLVGREVKRSRHDSPPVQASSSSSSSSSSSEEEDDSGSEDSASRSPSPYPAHSAPQPLPLHQRHPQLQHHQLHRAQTPSSVDEEDDEEDDEGGEGEEGRAVTPASSESGSTLGSGGLKLTISKAVLKQAALSSGQSKSSSSLAPPLSTTLFVGPAGGDTDATSGSSGGGGRGGRRGSKGSRRGRGGAKKGRRGSTSAKPASSSLSIRSSQPKKVKRKDLSGAKPSSSKGPSAIQVQSSNPVIIQLPTSRSRSSKSTPSHRSIISSMPTTAATAPAVGSDYHCPECGLRDDGSPMIGCDGCDSWIHWTCAGITREPPADAKWYCPTCVRSRQSEKKKKGRKRKRTN